MPRKFNDPIMKSKNALTNGETSSKSNQSSSAESQKPGYVPANIKNGIDFSDLSDSLKNLAFGDITANPGNEGWKDVSKFLEDLKKWLVGFEALQIDSSYNLNFQSQQGDINNNLLNLILNGNGLGSIFNLSLTQGADLSALLGLINATGATGGGSAIEYLQTYSNQEEGISYDWFRTELINSTDIPFVDKAYLNILLYTIALPAATQTVQVYDSVSGNTIWSYNSPLAAARPGRTYLGYMDNMTSEEISEQGVITRTYEFWDKVVYPMRERTVVTPTSKLMTLPLLLTDIISDRSIITGATTTVSGTANMPEAEIEMTEVIIGGNRQTSLGHPRIIDHNVSYSIADSPLTHIQVAGGNAYNYSSYPMTASVMRLIISGEIDDGE